VGEKRTGAHARSASRACARRCMNIAAYAAPDVALRGRPACVCVSASPQAQFLHRARPVRCVVIFKHDRSRDSRLVRDTRGRRLRVDRRSAPVDRLIFNACDRRETLNFQIRN